MTAKYSTRYKPLFNDTHDPNYAEDDPNDYTDNSRKYDKLSSLSGQEFKAKRSGSRY